jgi:hypothetical protein
MLKRLVRYLINCRSPCQPLKPMGVDEPLGFSSASAIRSSDMAQLNCAAALA